MKPYILTLIIFLFSTTGALSQSMISFSYDAAGNRISRTIVFNTSQANAPAAPAEDEEITEVHSEMLSEMILSIYPNPTEGILKIDIQNMPAGVKADISLYNSSGNLIVLEQGIDFSTTIDITSHPSGIYILKIIIGDEHTEWKIIKK